MFAFQPMFSRPRPAFGFAAASPFFEDEFFAPAPRYVVRQRPSRAALAERRAQALAEAHARAQAEVEQLAAQRERAEAHARALAEHEAKQLEQRKALQQQRAEALQTGFSRTERSTFDEHGRPHTLRVTRKDGETQFESVVDGKTEQLTEEEFQSRWAAPRPRQLQLQEDEGEAEAEAEAEGVEESKAETTLAETKSAEKPKAAEQEPRDLFSDFFAEFDELHERFFADSFFGAPMRSRKRKPEPEAEQAAKRAATEDDEDDE